MNPLSVDVDEYYSHFVETGEAEDSSFHHNTNDIDAIDDILPQDVSNKLSVNSYQASTSQTENVSSNNSSVEASQTTSSSKITLNEFIEEYRKRLGRNNKLKALPQDLDPLLENVSWSSSDTQLQPIPIFVKTLTGSLIQLQVSLEDSVQVIVQSLLEACETCYVTCYHLKFQDEKLDEFRNLNQVKNLHSHATIEMTQDLYDEKSARNHVRRLKEILSESEVSESKLDGPSTSLLPLFGNINSDTTEVANHKDVNVDLADIEKLELPLIDTSLSRFFPTVKNSGSESNCIRNVSYSGWNPPPGYRKLLGDLFYLEVETIENKIFYVTAVPEGYFVNQTQNNKTFLPDPLTKYHMSHSLVDLLNQLSPKFRTNFAKVLVTRQGKDPFELYSVPHPLRPWVGMVKNHSYDMARLNSLADPSEVQFRDWNEEFQSSKELPSSTIRERIIRDHAIIKVNNDFVDAATKGAIAVINKSVPPLNPTDSKAVQMYIYNNIFFSYAIDTETRYEEVEGRYTYASANNDLKGVILYNNNNIAGLYTLATAIVDYRGFRMVAQSMIPGIFNPSTIVYSSTDFEKEKEFVALFEQSAHVLHIKPHQLSDKNGNSVMVFCSEPTKGIVGTDGRKYIIDLCRATPRDANFKGSHCVMAVLRPELLEIYSQSISDSSSLAAFNTDVFASSKCCGDPKEIQQDEESVEAAASFLMEVVIPNMIQEFTSFVCVPVDGPTLTTLMHHRGINIRYLGYIASLTPAWPFIYYLCIKEMVVRAAKNQLRGILFETPLSYLSSAIAHFLNCFLGTQALLSKQATSKKKKKKKTSNVNDTKSGSKTAGGPAFALTQFSLWQSISVFVKQKFQFDLDEEVRIKLATPDNVVSMLRNLCLKMGLQTAARDYDWSSSSPFKSEDILDVFPVVKHSQPKTVDGHDLLECGVSFLSQGRLDVAFELLSEALVIFSQVYGPMHQATAICFSNMAMVLYQSGDPAEAVVYQQKAVIINERVQGADHHETAQSYGNLALFCHKMGKVQVAFHYIQRALYLGYLACGLTHPDNGTSFTNIGMILQDLGTIKASLCYFMKALKCNEMVFGSDHLLLTAAICHAIAVDYSLLLCFKEALEYERRNCNILLQVIKDEKDPRIQESTQLWKSYLTKALEQGQRLPV